MKRYIEANRLFMDIATSSEFDSIDVSRIRRFIDMAPTVEINEKHGVWIKHPNPEFGRWHICSMCGSGYNNASEETPYRYCPQCGCKMDGKNK